MAVATFALVLAVWAVALLWQADGDHADISIAPHREACGLLTMDEVEAQLGTAAFAGQDPYGDGDACYWRLGGAPYDPQRGQFIGVRLDFLDYSSYDSYGAEVGHPSGAETVRRIKVGAADGLLESVRAQRRVLVRSGRHVLQLYASTSATGPWRVDEAVALLRIALERLA